MTDEHAAYPLRNIGALCAVAETPHKAAKKVLKAAKKAKRSPSVGCIAITYLSPECYQAIYWLDA